MVYEPLYMLTVETSVLCLWPRRVVCIYGVSTTVYVDTRDVCIVSVATVCMCGVSTTVYVDSRHVCIASVAIGVVLYVWYVNHCIC